MELKVLEEDKNKIKILIEGEKTTICEWLRKRLSAKEEVAFVGYRILHPMERKIEFYLETKKDNAREVLINTLQEMIKEVQSFKKELFRVL